MDHHEADELTVCLDDVFITDELGQRPSRDPDYKIENDALAAVAAEMAANPSGVLQKLVDVGVKLCRAESVGISVHEPGGNQGIFRWHAISGAFAGNVNGTLPREASPCGLVVDRNSVLLLRNVDKAFPRLRAIEPRIYESLLLPWSQNGAPVGTVWALHHNSRGRFDAEDARLLTSLARFAAAGWQMVLAIREAESSVYATAAELRDSEARARALIAHLPGAAAFVVDDTLRYILAEGEALADAGLRSSQLVGRTIGEALGPAKEAEYAPDYRRALAGKPFAREHTAHGRTYLTRGGPLRDADGSVCAAVAVSTDITARVAAEVALREGEQRIRLALDAAELGTFVWHPDDDTCEADARMLALLGLDAGSSGIACATLEQAIHPEDRQRWRAGFARAADPAGPGTLNAELRTFRPDGSVRWLVITARTSFDDGSNGSRRPVRMSGVVSDVTAARNAETALRTSEERHAFLLQLSDALRPLADSAAMQSEACRLLGEHLGADRAYYVEVDEAAGVARVERDWVRHGSASLVGEHQVADFGWSVEILRRGECHVISDTQTSPLVPPADRPASAALGIVSCMGAPLIKEGGLVGALCVTAARPRLWTDGEVSLLRETGERIWAAVERARAEAALRVSEAQYRTLFTSMDQGFCTVEVLFDEHGEAVDLVFLETNPAFVRHTGLEHASGKRLRELNPSPEPFWFETYGQIAKTGKPMRFEHEAASLGRYYDVYAFRIGRPEEHRVAILFSDILARRNAEAALRASEEKYHSLFDSIDEGFTTIEVIFDSEGRPVDLRYLETNRSFARQSGVQDCTGKTASEVLPGLEPHWLGKYARVALTGKAERFEQYVTPTDRWFSVYLSRVGGEGSRVVAAVFDDITARKRAELALRASEECFRLLVVASSEMVYRMSADWTQLYELEGKSVLADTSTPSLTWLDDYVPRGDHDSLRSAVAEAVQTGSMFRLEHRVIRADGTTGWVSSRAIPFRDERGRIVEWFGAASDITDRKRTEAAVQESEEQFRRAVEEAPIPVIMHAENGQVLHISHTWTELTGFRAEDIPTFEAWLNQAYGEGADAVRRHMQDLFAGTHRSIDIEIPVRTRSGERRHWSFSASSPGLLRDGRRFIVGMALDITARKQAEEALRASEERFRLLVENVREYALFQLDLQGHVTTWNPGAERLFGYKAEQIVGQSFERFLTVADQHSATFQNEFDRVLAGERVEDARWLVRRDGSQFWARWGTEPVRDETGVLRGVAKVLRDETDRQRAEEAIRASLLEKEQLLREVHHRVKNNLQVITSLINLQAQDIEDERVLGLFDETRNRVYSIAAIHELIYRSASFAAIHLSDYARQLVPNLVRFYDLYNRVTVDIVGDGATLELERAVPFGLLLSELVSNACKHAFPGQVAGSISVDVRAADGYATVEVADTGVGLPANFDYRQASSLGLQLVHNLAIQLRASVSVSPGPGTRVIVRIPQEA